MKKAFTLAEVLITLGIIGVVAAITMPMLVSTYQERELVSRLKKDYSNISQSYAHSLVENGLPKYWHLGEEGNSDGAKYIQSTLISYFKVWENCETNNGCWPNNTIANLDGTMSELNVSTNPSYSKFTIIDGTNFAFKVLSNDCSLSVGESGGLKDVCAEMLIDINGPKNPNKFGFDVFKFYLTQKGIMPAGLSGETVNSFENSCLNKVSGLGCTAWVLYRANMDYFHCSDISWGGKQSCKNIFNNHNSDL